MTNNGVWATFTSSLPAQDPRNPHPKGYSIAYLIYAGLRRAELHPEKVENWRDVGYSIDCVIDQKRVYLFLALHDRMPEQWALCCTSDLGWLSRFLGNRDDQQRLRLARAVDLVLKQHEEFTNVRWYPNWRGGQNEQWSDQPG